MTTEGWLTTRQIGEIFSEEITGAGGKVSDTFDDGTRLYVRAVLPGVHEVRAGDRVQGGVALRATQEDILVHPYVFRQVCRNGAIRAHALQSRHIRRSDFAPDAEVQLVYALGEAIRACCSEDAFSEGAYEMRRAADSEADFALAMMSTLARIPADLRGTAAVQEVIGRFFRAPDRSRFGFMNAVTSVARDNRDPEVRWRLEELGGSIPIAPDEPDLGPSLTAAKVAVERVLVGARCG